MKHLTALLVVLSLFSCKKNEAKGGFVPEQKTDYVYTTEGEEATKLSPAATLGRDIFEGKGNCASCHKPDVKTAGPSIQEIAKIYTAKKGSIVNFLKGDGEPLVDPSQYEIMKANIYLTKTYSDEELKGIEAYIAGSDQ